MSCCVKFLLILIVISLGISFAWLWDSGAISDLTPTWPTEDLSSEPISADSVVNREQPRETIPNLEENYVIVEQQTSQPADPQESVQEFHSDPLIQADQAEPPQSWNERADIPIQFESPVTDNLPSQISPDPPPADSVGPQSEQNIQTRQTISEESQANQQNTDASQWQSPYLDEDLLAQARSYAQVLADEMKRMSEVMSGQSQEDSVQTAGQEDNCQDGICNKPGQESQQQLEEPQSTGSDQFIQEMPRDDLYFW